MHHSEVRAREVLKRLAGRRLVGAEVGVWHGEMSAHMLRMLPDLELYLVDNWLAGDQQPESYRASGDFRATRSAQVMEDAEARTVANVAFAADRVAIIRKASLEAAADVPDGTLDFVFIDAEHTYQAMKADIAAWLPKLKPGGLLSGHDYSPKGWPGVVRAVDEFVAGRPGLQMDLGEQSTWFLRLP